MDIANPIPDWHIRPAQTFDAERAGQILVGSYVKAGLEQADGPYLPLLRDIEGRSETERTKVLVAVTAVTNEVIGTVTVCGYGSGLTMVSDPHEFEFRMLAVDLQWRRAGVAAALVNACDEYGAAMGYTTSIGCSWEHNDPAKALYTRLGFQHYPDRDWYYQPCVGAAATDELLHVYVRPIQFCPRCGRPERAVEHGDCVVRAELEPPRYCSQCGRRMKVQITPRGWSAICSRHGTFRG